MNARLRQTRRATDPYRQAERRQWARDDRVVLTCYPRMMPVEMAAKYLGIAVQTLRNHAGEVPGRKHWGRKVVYDRNVLDQMLDRNSGHTDLFLDGVRLVK